MELDPTRMCELLVGLPDVDVIGVDQPEPGELIVMVEAREVRPSCSRCATVAWVKDRREVDLVDLPRLVRPWSCGWSGLAGRVRGCGAGLDHGRSNNPTSRRPGIG